MLYAIELSGDVEDVRVTDFVRPVVVHCSFGRYFLLLPDNASARKAWRCGHTLFGIPYPSTETALSMSFTEEEVRSYPRACMLRIASLVVRNRVLRVDLRISKAVE